MVNACIVVDPNDGEGRPSDVVGEMVGAAPFGAGRMSVTRGRG